MYIHVALLLEFLLYSVSLRILLREKIMQLKLNYKILTVMHFNLRDYKCKQTISEIIINMEIINSDHFFLQTKVTETVMFPNIIMNSCVVSPLSELLVIYLLTF